MASDRHQWRLIQCASQGDATAFGSLYQRYLDASYRYFYFRLGNVAVAEQLTDRLFLRAWEKLSVDPELSVLPFTIWLFRLANQVITDHNILLAALDITEERPPLVAWSLNTASNRLPRLHPRHLALAIRALDPLAQQVVVLRFIHGLSHKEVAMVVGDVEYGSHVLQYRALSELQEIMTRKRAKDNPFANAKAIVATFCLDHIIEDAWTVEACLEHLAAPGLGLKATLQLGLMVVDARHVKPRRAFEHGARQRIQQELRRHARRRATGTGWRSRLSSYYLQAPSWMVVILFAGLSLLSGAAGASAAYALVDSSKPGDRLYRYDLGLEQRYFSLLRDQNARTRYRLRLTQERLTEAEILAGQGDLGRLQVALVAYSLQVSALTQTIQVTHAETSNGTLDQMFAQQQEQLDTVLDTALASANLQSWSQFQGGDCPDASLVVREEHPIGLVLSAQSKANYEDVLDWACSGHSFGEILLALATSESRPITPEEILILKGELGGWGQLWQAMEQQEHDNRP